MNHSKCGVEHTNEEIRTVNKKGCVDRSNHDHRWLLKPLACSSPQKETYGLNWWESNGPRACNGSQSTEVSEEAVRMSR